MKTTNLLITIVLLSSAAHANFCKRLVAKATDAVSDVKMPSLPSLPSFKKPEVSLPAIKMPDVEVPAFDLSSVAVVKDRVAELVQESVNQCTRAGTLSVQFCGYAGLQTLPIVYRVVRFEPTIEKFREEIAYPLADMLIQMKSGIPGKEKDEAHFKFLLFWPELILKVQKCIPSQTIELSMNAATGMLLPSVKDDPGLLGDIAKQIQKAVLKKFWKNLKTNEENKDMSFTQRLKYATSQAMIWDGDAQFSAYVEQLVKDLGFDRLSEALSLYRDNE